MWPSCVKTRPETGLKRDRAIAGARDRVESLEQEAPLLWNFHLSEKLLASHVGVAESKLRQFELGFAGLPSRASTHWRPKKLRVRPVSGVRCLVVSPNGNRLV